MAGLLSLVVLTEVHATIDRPIQVLVLHSYHRGYPWTEGQHQGFVETLRDDTPTGQLQVYSEYLDTKRRQYTDFYRAFLSRYLRDKYPDFEPNLIYVTDDNALDFVLRFGKTLFPGVPVVFSGVNDLQQKRHLSPVLQGVFEQVQVQRNLALLQRLYPDLRQVVFVGDASATHRAMADHIRREARDHFPGLKVQFVAERSIDRVVKALGRQPAGPVLLTTIGGFLDDEGQVIPPSAVIARLNTAGPFPLFVMEDTYLLPGAIGGWVNSSHAQGRAAGKVATALLTQDRPPSSRPNAYPAEAVFDYPALQAHRIPRRLLPEEARILHEPTTLLYRYQREMLVLGCVVLGLLWAIVLLSLNIRRRKRAERELEASRWQMVRLFEGAPDAIFVADFSGRILDVNEHAAESLGYSRDQLRQMTAFDIDPLLDPDRLAVLQQAIPTHNSHHFETEHLRADGRQFPVDIRVSLCQWEGQSAHLCYVRDITERKQAEQKLLENEKRLNHLAFHDALTDLPNRLLFQDRLTHALQLAQRHDTGLAVLFLDLDRFKTINDSLGHNVGDRVLNKVAQRLRRTVRSTDTVARLGGDEFVILVEDVTDPDSLASLAQKVVEAVQPPMPMAEGELFVTTSVGLAVYPQDAATPQELMKLADVAMYQAKEGRNTYRFYQPEMDARATEFLFMESSLRRALEQDQLVLHYQPQFELEDGHLVGIEALLRWQHPEKGMVSPGEFIPLAEETGLIVPMGEWVLRQACRQITAWADAGLPTVPVAVNISPAQFRLEDWSQTVAQVLQQAGLPPHLLELEITENLLMEQTESAMATMDALQQLGVAVSIDDFGAGYSSLAYLKQFPLKKLKIDRSFITDFDTSFNDAAIVCAMINLGWSLGLQIVAEGIETEAQLKFLIEQGCHQGQGFLLGRPMTAEAMAELLRKHV